MAVHESWAWDAKHHSMMTTVRTLSRIGLGFAPGWSTRLAAGTVGGLGLVASLLVARRLAGALYQPASDLALGCLGLTFLASVVFLRVLGVDREPRRGALNRAHVLRIVGALAMTLAAASVSLPATGWVKLTLFWLLVLLALAGLLWPEHHRRTRGVPDPRGPHGNLPAVRPTAQDPTLIHRITRRMTVDGEEMQGLICVTFQPGQRAAQAHVAFCPPFARVPNLEFQQSASTTARLSLGQLLPYGCRFDLKRSDDVNQSARVELEFIARLGTEPSAPPQGTHT